MGGVPKPRPSDVGTWEGLPDTSMIKTTTAEIVMSTEVLQPAPVPSTAVWDSLVASAAAADVGQPSGSVGHQQRTAAVCEEGAVAFRLGTFCFKGSEEVIPMVNVLPAGIQGRRQVRD